MGCSGSQPRGESGAPRQAPEVSKAARDMERRREQQLSSRLDMEQLPQAIQKEMSRRSSGREDEDFEERFGVLPDSDGDALQDQSGLRPGCKVRLSKTFSHNTEHLQATNSQADFSRADQTMIIFDWDDTLCPSTAMRKHASFDQGGRLKLRVDAETRAELDALQSTVIPLLRFAKSVGKVIIVTNAKTPWVDISCKNFLPGLKAMLKDVPVIYALELVKVKDGLEGFDSETGCLLTEVKARAMKTAVTEFYSRYPNQSWKNIVSIGDALFEHTAIRQVVSLRPNNEKRCRTKTVKLLEGPTTAGLVVQLSIVSAWLSNIVKADEDIEIDLAADEDTLNTWVAKYGEVQ